MKNIEVAVLNQGHDNPGGMMMFLAKLTQRGHSISDMKSLMNLYYTCVSNKQDSNLLKSVSAMPHGTIKRFAPITVAIVGASRRFLAQARTHQVGLDYVSASLQYSNYSGKAQFVVPYALTSRDAEAALFPDTDEPKSLVDMYLQACDESMSAYAEIASAADNDTAGYTAPQGLRNILIIQGNHQAWDYFIRLRSCNRNTVETQYVTMLIWQALLNTEDGKDLFAYAGPDCRYGNCREGKMSCHHPDMPSMLSPTDIIEKKWPLLL